MTNAELMTKHEAQEGMRGVYFVIRISGFLRH